MSYVNCDDALDMALSMSTDVYVRMDVILIGSISDFADWIDNGNAPTCDTPVFSESVLTDDIRQLWNDLWDDLEEFLDSEM